MEKLLNRIKAGIPEDSVCTPIFFRLYDKVELEAFELLIEQKPYIKIFDTIETQVRTLLKSRKPNVSLSEGEIQKDIANLLGGKSLPEYGVWVYYPWSERIVHILDEPAFIEIRTNRNKYKITDPEQNILSKKKVGVIGLSVGQSVSITMAMERTFGELRIADFDDLEITNLNRLRSGVHNMGLLKTVLVAREIAEIDPYLKVTCFHEGITEENIESFLLDNGKLDILIDECDSVDVKINCRIVAKKHRIPVLMEASDRGTIDIERFDLEPNRSILHGYIDHLDISKLKGLKTSEEKLPYILPISGIETLSARMKASAVEVGQSISTWPQLASAVTMGGGMTADVCRRVLLDQLHISGRFFIDLEELIGDPEVEMPHFELPILEPLTIQHMKTVSALVKKANSGDIVTDSKVMEKLVRAAITAPSAGNMQPWKWYFDGQGLFLFHDMERTASFGDFKNMVSYLSLGTAIEHVKIMADGLKLGVELSLFPLGEIYDNNLVAAFWFRQDNTREEDLLGEYFSYRRTNRNPGNGKKIEREIINDLQASISGISGAKVVIIDRNDLIERAANIAGKADKLRIFIEEGHFDLFNRELKFANEDPDSVKEGLDVRTLDLKPKDQVGFRVIKDLKAIRLLTEWNGGGALETVSHDQVASAAAVGIVTMPVFNSENNIFAGRAVERVWLTATSHNVAFQPLLASVIHFARIFQGQGEGIPDKIQKEFKLLFDDFIDVFGIDGKADIPLFFFRLCYAEPAKLLSQRLDIDDVYFH